jgi:hypothetical protein
MKLHGKFISSAAKRLFGTAKNYPSYTPFRDHVVRGYTKDGLVRFSFVQNGNSLKTALVRNTILVDSLWPFPLQNNFQIKDKEAVEVLGKVFSTSLLISSFLKVVRLLLSIGNCFVNF